MSGPRTNQPKFIFPLKGKIILLFSTIFILGIFIYVFYAVNLFKEDKTAFIYDATLAKVESINDSLSFQKNQIETILNAYLNNLDESRVAKNYGESQKQLKQAILRSKLPIYEISIISKSSSDPKGLELLELALPPSIGRDHFRHFFSQQDLEFKSSSSPKMYSDIFQFDNEKVLQLPLNIGSKIAMVRMGISGLFKTFERQQSHLIILFPSDKKEQNFMFGQREIFALNKIKESDIRASIWDFLARSNTNAASTTVTNLNLTSKELNKNFPVLMGMKFNQELNLWILALVPESHAFKATRFLINRSVYLGGILISLTVFLGVLFARGLTRPLESLARTASQLALGKFGIVAPVSGRDEISELTVTFNQMSQDIAHYIGEMKEKNRLESEMAVAQLVQSTFFPSTEKNFGIASVSGKYLSASECGGDWWGSLRFGNKIVVVICDATGHGVGAALMTATAFCAVRNLESVIKDRPHFLDHPGHIMQYLNYAALGMQGKMLMTSVVGIYNLETGLFKYSNASHCPPLLFKAKLNNDEVAKDQFIPLMEANGHRLGHKEQELYDSQEMLLEKGDAILFHSDGVVEVQNPEGKPFGQRRFIKSLIDSKMNDAKSIVDTVFNDITAFQNGQHANDDITTVVLQRNKICTIKYAFYFPDALTCDWQMLTQILASKGIQLEKTENLDSAQVIFFGLNSEEDISSESSQSLLNSYSQKVYVISSLSSDINIRKVLTKFNVSHLTGVNAPNFYDEVADQIYRGLVGPIWGIETYLGQNAKVEIREIDAVSEIIPSVNQLIEQFDLSETFSTLKDYLSTVSVELLSNAVFDAARDPSGALKYYQLEKRKDLVLQGHEKVRIAMGKNNNVVALSVTDNFGGLTKEMLLKGIERCLDNPTPKSGDGGAGMGLYFAFSMSSALILNVWDVNKTEVIALFDLQKRQKIYKERVSSLHFFREGILWPGTFR